MNVILLVSVLFLIPQTEGSIWEEDYDQAKIQATNQSKHMLLVFTGSDWCRSCMKLEKEVLSQAEFQAFVSENFVAYRADFPRKTDGLRAEIRASNSQLIEQYNPNGSFPFMVLLSSEEELLWESNYLPDGLSFYLNELSAFVQ